MLSRHRKSQKHLQELYKSLKLNQMPKLDSFRTTLSKLVTTKQVTRQDGILYYITKKRRT